MKSAMTLRNSKHLILLYFPFFTFTLLVGIFDKFNVVPLQILVCIFLRRTLCFLGFKHIHCVTYVEVGNLVFVKSCIVKLV